MEKSHRRRSIRLKNYDYADEGAYFVTVCTHQKQCIFGYIEDDEMNLSAEGEIVAEEWEQTAVLRDNVELDAFVVMPNHIHGIILIRENLNNKIDASVGDTLIDDTNINPVGAQRAAPLQTSPGGITPNNVTPNSLGAIVRGFKSAVTRHLLNNTPGAKVWQGNYWEHIIRNEERLNTIRGYCATNPQRWYEDDLYLE
jgi:REP element-mobilizing transposase RayT